MQLVTDDKLSSFCHLRLFHGLGWPVPPTTFALFPQAQRLPPSFLAHRSLSLYGLVARKAPDAAGGGVARDQRPADCCPTLASPAPASFVAAMQLRVRRVALSKKWTGAGDLCELPQHDGKTHVTISPLIRIFCTGREREYAIGETFVQQPLQRRRRTLKSRRLTFKMERLKCAS
jgi:hypothetical protein